MRKAVNNSDARALPLPTPANPVIIYDHPEKSLDYFYSITIKVPQRVTFIITQSGTTLLQLYTCYTIAEMVALYHFKLLIVRFASWRQFNTVDVRYCQIFLLLI